jgi:hypothetical protein
MNGTTARTLSGSLLGTMPILLSPEAERWRAPGRRWGQVPSCKLRDLVSNGTLPAAADGLDE